MNRPVINRKVVKTKSYRLLNLRKFIDDSHAATDVIGKVLVDVPTRRIWVITRPYQIVSWNYNNYYHTTMEFLWNMWEIIHTLGVRKGVDISESLYILDDESSGKVVKFTCPLEKVPIISDLFWVDYTVNQSLLTNLYNECAESLLKENETSKTTLTMPTYDELMASGYFQVAAEYLNDTQQHSRHLPPLTWVEDEIDENEHFFSVTASLINDIGTWSETSVGEISTNPF